VPRRHASASRSCSEASLLLAWWSRGRREQGREKVPAVAVGRQGRRRPPRLPRRDVACCPPAGNTRRHRTLQRGGSSSAAGWGASPAPAATGPAGLGRTAPLLQPPAAAPPLQPSSSSLLAPPARKERQRSYSAASAACSAPRPASRGAPPLAGREAAASSFACLRSGRRRTGLRHGSLHPTAAADGAPPWGR
jgi:hypothetical protein